MNEILYWGTLSGIAELMYIVERNGLFTWRRYALFCRCVQCTVACTLSSEQERVLTAITLLPESVRAPLFECGAVLKLDIESSLFAVTRHSIFSSRFRKIPKSDY